MKKLLLVSIFSSLLFSSTISIAQDPIREWTRTINYPNNGYTFLNFIKETPDGGYILAGQSDAGPGGEKTSMHKGETDYWIIKLRPDRTVEWDASFGGARIEQLDAINLSADGGYLISGHSNSDASVDKSENARGGRDNDGNILSDYWIVKISSTGIKQWDKTIGTETADEFVYKVVNTQDGGYIVAGNGYNFKKLSSAGEIEWDRTYHAGNAAATDFKITPDGGLIIGGFTNTVEPIGDKSQRGWGKYDYWVLKVDSDGTKQWDRTFGGIYYDYLSEVTQLADGGYLLAGTTESIRSGDIKGELRGVRDAWIIRLAASGNLVWERNYGGSAYGQYKQGSSGLAFSEEMPDGRIILNGTSTGRASVDKASNDPGRWTVIIDQQGNIVEESTMSNQEGAFLKTSDGGFLLYTSDFRISKFSYPKTSPIRQTTVRINAGGQNFTTATKKVFVADQYYSGIDRTSSIASGDILNTTNDVLYRSGRSSPSFSYNIPVVNGQLNVTLHFAEVYFGAPGKKGGAGSRQFNVNIEGSRKLTNYDIFVAAGGAMRANQITFPVAVTDGVLNIDFLSGAADLPKVCAIEVVATSVEMSPIADAYVRDGIYNTTNFSAVSSLDIKTVSSDQSATRASYLRFQLPAITSVVAAKLRIYGHNHENTKSISVHAYGVNNDSWSETSITKANAPIVSTASLGYVAVNDVYRYYEIDVTSYVKAQQQLGDLQITLYLNDPSNRNSRLLFNSKEAASNPPQLVIQTTSSGARLGQEEVSTETREKEASTVFPNPARDHITLKVSPSHQGKIDLQLTSMTGLSFQLQHAQSNVSTSKLGVTFPVKLQAGIYFLKVKSETYMERVKVLVTE